jgi:hypothetical protein
MLWQEREVQNAMTALEIVARALCDYEGRCPDTKWHGVAQWERYKAQAQTVLNALLGDQQPPRNEGKTL